MKSCITCGMPLEGNHANDIGLELSEGLVCKFDSEYGKIKSGNDVFEGGVMFFLGEVSNGDRELAERLTRRNMRALPYWQKHLFEKLSGEEASDEEYQTAMAKLHEVKV